MSKRKMMPVVIDDRYATGDAFERLPVNTDRRDSFITTMMRLSDMYLDEPWVCSIKNIYDRWRAYYEKVAEEDEMETDRTDNWLTQPQVAGQALREFIRHGGEDPDVWIRRKAKGHYFKLNFRTFLQMVWNFGETLWNDEIDTKMNIGQRHKYIAERIAALCTTKAQVEWLAEFTGFSLRYEPSQRTAF